MSRISGDVLSILRSPGVGALAVGRDDVGPRITRASLITRSGDGLDASSRGDGLFGDARGLAEGERALGRISFLLAELEGLADAGRGEAIDSSRELQRRVEGLVGGIERIARSASLDALSRLSGGAEFGARGVDEAVSAARGLDSTRPSVDVRDPDFVITDSAQVGGFFLSFGGANLDLGSADDQLVLEISGREGSRELSFASGTALVDVADQINVFTDRTGVSATQSGTGIRLDSTGVGSSQFVTVRILDDGGLTDEVGGGVGIYGYAEESTSFADASGSVVAFDSAAARDGVTDTGRDLQGFLTNREAASGEAARSVDLRLLLADVADAFREPAVDAAESVRASLARAMEGLGALRTQLLTLERVGAGGGAPADLRADLLARAGTATPAAAGGAAGERILSLLG